MTAARDTPDNVRRRNLSRVLQLVHHNRALSRADITGHIRLNRSTTGDLVAELVRLGLVVEADPTATSRVGRPSPQVQPDPRPAVIAVNPEIDAITAAVVGLGAVVHHRLRYPVAHPPGPEEAVDIIAGLVAKLRALAGGDRRFLSVGLAVPGLVRASDGVVRWAPHLGWREVPLTRAIQDAVGLPVFADNDASLGALAERLFGVGQGVGELIYLNGGASGIGGGVVIRGLPLGGAHGYAGEFGHNRPGLLNAGDGVTVNGTLEDEVNRARLLATVGLDSADEPALRAALVASTDPGVREELDRQQRVLAVALANAINVFNPELVVLGGFLATLLDWNSPALERAVEEATIPAAWEGVQLRPAALADDRLLIGAAELAFGPVLRDPARFSSGS